MGFFCGLLVFIFSLSLQAQVACSGVHNFDSRKSWSDQSHALFRQQMLGDPSKGQKELYFSWSMPKPMEIRQISDSMYVRYKSNKSRRVYQNNEDLNSPFPLQATNKLMGVMLPFKNDSILRAVYKNYEGRIQDEIIDMVKGVEEQIAQTADDRQEIGFVATGHPDYGGKIIGTMRFFNGTKAHSPSPAMLPLEYAFKMRGIPLQTSEKLQVLREQNPNALIYEIGKFSLEAPVEYRDRARSLLELFWLKHYVDTMPEATFYAHVATRAHLRLYQNRYGFRVAEEISIPGHKEKEYIIKATAEDFRKAFEKLYPIPRIQVKTNPH